MEYFERLAEKGLVEEIVRAQSARDLKSLVDKIGSGWSYPATEAIANAFLTVFLLHPEDDHLQYRALRGLRNVIASKSGHTATIMHVAALRGFPFNPDGEYFTEICLEVQDINVILAKHRPDLVSANSSPPNLIERRIPVSALREVNL